MTAYIFGHPIPGHGALKLFAASALAVTAVLSPDDGSAAGRCTDHDKVASVLQDKHDETPVSLGLASSGKLVQVFSTEDGATWTLVLTDPDGTSCVVAAGRYWQTVTPKPRGPQA